jgi:hypothetical protein
VDENKRRDLCLGSLGDESAAVVSATHELATAFALLLTLFRFILFSYQLCHGSASWSASFG